MLAMFQPAQKARKKAKVLVYGDAGTGKTRFALSWPGVAMIDTEGGADLYGGRYDFQVLRTKSLADVVKAIEAVKKDNGQTVQTLVIDPITVVWQVLQEAGQQAAEARAQRYNRAAEDVALTQRDWGLIKRKLYSAMIDLVNLPVNVVLTAHLKDETETRKDGRGQDVQVKIGEKPDAEKKTAYWCDVVIRLAVEKGEHVGYVEKDRSGLFKVGQRIPDISYQHFVPLLEAYAAGAVVEQPNEDEAIQRDAALIATQDTPRSQPPAPNGQAAPRPPLPSNLPTRPDALLTSVNGRVEVPYDNIPHLWQALRNEYNDPRWQWPQPRDLDGWRDAYARAFAHAQRKVTPASPVALSEGDAEPEQSF